MTTLYPERTVEQTDDGAFRRQPNWFRTRFGQGSGLAPVEAGKYRLVVSTGCGWSRRQTILRRLLGLDEALPVAYVTARDKGGWFFGDSPDGTDPVLGVRYLNDVYRATDPGYTGRGTVPTVVDTTTGTVVTNDYHTLGIDLETVWQPLHGDGAPDLYPEDLRPQIDLLNQQLFDDVNNGPYKVLFARTLEAAAAAKAVWEARLTDLDLRLATRRYLFGERLTDSDVRLFVTLASFDTGYRPSFPAALGEAKSVSDFPHLWGYARDLFATPGFVDEREKVSLGLAPDDTGSFSYGFGDDRSGREGVDPLAPWLVPHGREGLTGSPLTSGPGGAGTDTLWRWGISS